MEFRGFDSRGLLVNENIQSLSVHIWLAKSRTVLIQKDPAKGNAVGNYRPTACLNLLWKLKTGKLLINSISIWKMKTCYWKNKRVVDMPPEALRTSS